MTRIMARACFVMVATAALPAGAMAQAAPYNCQNVAQRVAIGAQPLGKAIGNLSKQTSCPFSIDAKTDSIKGHTVKGTMTPIAAAVALVRGTGLEAIPINQGIGIGRYEQNLFDAKVARLTFKVRNGVKAGRISAAHAASLSRQLNGVTTSVHQVARAQGFVGAADKARYRRTIAGVTKAVS